MRYEEVEIWSPRFKKFIPYTVLFDSGATYSWVSRIVVEREDIGPLVPLSPEESEEKTSIDFSGNKIVPTEKVAIRVKYAGQTRTGTFLIPKRLPPETGDVILGNDILERFGEIPKVSPEKRIRRIARI